MKLHTAGEDYLEAVLILQKKLGMVRSVDVARYMEVSKPSVCYAVGTLREGGFLTTDENHYLVGIHERTHIEKRPDGAAYTEDEGRTWTEIPKGSTVSMNMWGFTASILKELGDRFPLFLEKNLQSNPMKCEYFLPSVVGELLAEDKATVEVLKSMDKWYGVTYKEDKPVVVAAIRTLKESGLYPEKLWEE